LSGVAPDGVADGDRKSSLKRIVFRGNESFFPVWPTKGSLEDCRAI
jgi:hypothetical protein